MIICGDCLDVMRGMELNSVDAIVTDPPYGLEFMGKEWDHGIPGVPFWTESLRVAKPGCHLLAFGGTRTFHRLACAIEDAGWEIRDTLMWVYGSGFPKSHNLKGDKEGWGTALKPAWEPIIMARKPLDGTVAQNVQKWGAGAVNVDGCRIPSGGVVGKFSPSNKTTNEGWDRPWRHSEDGTARINASKLAGNIKAREQGRWPANLIHDGSEEVLELFPETKSGDWKGQITGGKGTPQNGKDSYWGKKDRPYFWQGDSGSAARFFYCAKASRSEREMGCDDSTARMRNDGCLTDIDNPYQRGKVLRNHHPTVKPLALMRYLCRLVTPPNGTILDPFMGSGTTGMAAQLEGFRFIGIEKDAEYCEIAKRRIEARHD